MGDLLSNLMHMCDRHPEFGCFDEVHASAPEFYEEETSTDEEYARYWA